jgi:crotonobetaine/carnitine-CoA ligase
MTEPRGNQGACSDLVPACIAALVLEQPDAPAIIFVDGPEWCWSELQRRVRDHAQALQALGVGRDEPVLSWLPNGPLAVLNLLALAELGAVYVPVNPGYRGEGLAHVIANSGARLMIAHGELVARLEPIERARLETLVVIGAETPRLPGVRLLRADSLAGEGARLQPPVRPLAPWDTMMVVYTSGTTGPAKGVLSSFRHAHAAVLGFRNIGPRDRNLTTLPMFHVGGVWGILWAVYHGGSVVLATHFRTQDFWSIVKRYRITTTGLLGSMVDFLVGQPVAAGERDHGLASVLVAPYGPSALLFAERFGVDVYTEFNMSELAVPMFIGPNPQAVGTCGVAASGTTLRLVDASDIEVPDGAVGELLVRMDEPWTISHGYHNDPVATARAWRNGWFHTGDLFRRDAAGHFFFIDRATDSIRRRGENISAFEVEAGLRRHEAIAEAAAVAVPAPGGNEQEVMAVIRLADGQTLEPVVLIEFLRPLIAPHMLPRYVRFVTDFPRTPTQKIEKFRLRAQGITPDSWDRERAGVQVRRDALERRG